MSGSNTAPEDAVMRELVAAFGEEKARRIMGDTTPRARRKPVPTRVGVAAKPMAALTRKPTGRPGWRELNEVDHLEGRPRPVLRVQIRRLRRAVTCAACGVVVPKGEESLRLTRVATWQDYCGPCGAAEARRG